MSEPTRNYINQWIIKSSNAIEKAGFNIDRIYEAVRVKGDYYDILEVLIECMRNLVRAKATLPKLQSLINDPRANKIEGS